MDLVYAHQLTVKFRLTRQLDSHKGNLPYDWRGWPLFETAVASLISTSWNVLDFGQVDFSKPIEYFELEAPFSTRVKLRGWGKDPLEGHAADTGQEAYPSSDLTGGGSQSRSSPARQHTCIASRPPA